MDCGYCERFCNSQWRTNPDAEEEAGKKQTKAKARYCKTIDKYINRNREICEKFVPYHLFYCDRCNQFQHVEACISRVAKGEVDECYNCPQYKTIVDVQKARHFMKRRQAKELEEASKPKLVRRTP